MLKEMKPSNAILFKRLGYLILRNALDRNHLDQIESDISTLCQSVSGIKDETNLGGYERLLYIWNHIPDKYNDILRVLESLQSIMKIFADDAIRQNLREIGITIPHILARPQCHFMFGEQNSLFDNYHRDWPFMLGSRDSAICWTPLAGADKNNFGLHVIPGSHHWDTSDDVKSELNYNGKYTELCAEPGDLIIMSAFLFHRSGPGHRDGMRLAISCRFNNLAETSFIERAFYEPFMFTPKLPTPSVA